MRTLESACLLLGTEHRWCEDPIESACLLLGPEHRWCEDPLESALFIIIILLGTEHRWCEDPIESALFIIILLLYYYLFSKLNRIFEGLNMLEKSRNFAHAPEVAKIYI